MTAYAIRGVEYSHLVRQLAGFRGILEKRIQFGLCDAHQATRRVQPERAIVILDRPVNRVTGQSVFAAERNKTAVLEAAQPVFCRDPQGTLAIELKVAHVRL